MPAASSLVSGHFFLLYSPTIRTRRHFSKKNEQSVRIVVGLRECGARSSPVSLNDTEPPFAILPASRGSCYEKERLWQK